ncbi:hypothetical protein [Gemmatirosa kalamazoonensis]|nr:hypothetical protein [Gemmatirosa kalamazoonensis]
MRAALSICAAARWNASAYCGSPDAPTTITTCAVPGPGTRDSGLVR